MGNIESCLIKFNNEVIMPESQEEVKPEKLPDTHMVIDINSFDQAMKYLFSQIGDGDLFRMFELKLGQIRTGRISNG